MAQDANDGEGAAANGSGLARAAHLAACVSLIALTFLCLAWELVLAPLRPGGSWLALKAVPLLAPLFGVLHGRRRTFAWALPLLAPAYFTEGIVRTWSESGMSARLALVEALLVTVFFVAGVAWLRATARRGLSGGKSTGSG